MPDKEKVVKSLKWFRDREKWREGIMIHDDHAEVRKQICDNAIELLKEQQQTINSIKSDLQETLQIVSEQSNVIRCKECDNKECWGRAGDVVCGIDGTPHRPDWFCADGEIK